MWRRRLVPGLVRRRAFCSDSHQFITDGLGRLENQGIQVCGSETYSSLLQWCGTARSLSQGRRVHHHLVDHGYGCNTFLCNCVLQMYRKCGHLRDAREFFDSMLRKDVFSWNVMISGYVQENSSAQALELYHRMDVPPNRVTYVSVVAACGHLRLLHEGTAVHSRILSCKCDSDVVLETALVSMYGRCGRVDLARGVFERISRKNVVSWTAMLTAYAQNGDYRNAVEVYERLVGEGVEPTKITLIGALTAYSGLGDLASGERIHARLTSQRIRLDGPLGNSLISLYSRCGRIERARNVFEEMFQKDVSTWTSMITGYTQNGMPREALEIYRRMDLEPNSITYTAALTACSALGALDEGRKVHARLLKSGVQPDTGLSTALVTMYGNCGSLEDARMAFDGIERKNILSWNCMIGAYARFGSGTEAVNLFREMQLQGEAAPDVVTLIAVLGACANLGDLPQGRHIHQRAVLMNLFPDNVLETALVDMYAKCRSLKEARAVFESMRRRDVVAWTAAIVAYAQHGVYDEALELFTRMVEVDRVEPNAVTYVAVLGACSTPKALERGRDIHRRMSSRVMEAEMVQNALLNMYSKCGSLEEVKDVFEGMRQRTVVSWNTILTAYVQARKGKQAMELFRRMHDEAEVKPDETTVVTALAACSSEGEFAQGIGICSWPGVVELMKTKSSKSIVVENSLLNLHAKCGFLDSGRELFEAMQHRNSVSWTAMIVGYAQHGRGGEALEMYRRMQQAGSEPDAVSLTTILVACSHSGLVDEGRECWLSVVGEWNVSPPLVEHYICMVDLLGRAGWVEEAEEVISGAGMEKDPLAWMALLGGCKIHHDVERARRVEEMLMVLNPHEEGSHVLLSNIYLQPP